MSRPRFALLVCVLLFSGPVTADGFSRREEVRAFVEEMHERHGFDRLRLLQLFARARPQPQAIRAILSQQDPSRRSWRAYRARFVDAPRIAQGLRFWQIHAGELEAARQRYGVPEEIVVAIIGIETHYGRNRGKFPTLATLATLAFDHPPRADFFRRELEALLLLARDARADPLAYTGSYAGAMGMPQFLPSSIRNWAVDFDGDGRIDLDASAADVIGSIAHFLAAHGWQTGTPIAVPVIATGDGIDKLVEDGILPRLTPSEMAAYGIVAPADAPQLPCALIALDTPHEETEFWLGYRNFYVITRYNRSSFYAMAVFALATQLRQQRQAQLAAP
jgi:membrane-bound lytic murein transglycosylase B